MPSRPKPPRPPESWEESRLPGERSGEGLKDIFKLVLRDIRRKAGLAPQERQEPQEPKEPDKKAD